MLFQVSYVDARPVHCRCNHVFCFACGENWHDPVKCSLLRRWIKKCDDDSETSNWIAANTKECPKCNATIEKDGGCNHMVSSVRICRPFLHPNIFRYAKIKTARRTFAGCAWGRGSRTAAPGTIATGMTRTRRKPPATRKRSLDQPYNGTCSTATGT